jgi:CRISPR-associated protein Cas2
MSHWSLIAYDIRDPKRLRRVHAYLRTRAQALQLSVFLVQADTAELDAILDGVRARVDNRCDDIRLYAVTDPAALWSAGIQGDAVAGCYIAQPESARAGGLAGFFQGLFGREAA